MNIPAEFNPEPIGDSGDLMTLKEWKECVECGGFIDYDGHGRLATKTEKSDILIRPSQSKSMVIPAWATHVVWCNR